MKSYIQLFGIFEKFRLWQVSEARGFGSHPILGGRGVRFPTLLALCYVIIRINQDAPMCS